MSTARNCPTCQGPRRVIETRTLMDGRMRYRLECPHHGRETIYAMPGMVRPSRKGPAPTAQPKVLALVRDNPGIGSGKLAELYGVGRDRLFKHLQALVQAGAVVQKMASRSVGYYWHREHAQRADEWERTMRPRNEVPRAAYVGQVAAPRIGVMSPERVEWRQIGDQLVKVTIGACAIEPAAIVMRGPPPSRIQHPSQWGSL